MAEYEELSYYLEVIDPELEAELDAARVAYIERTGRTGIGAMRGSVSFDLERQVERARALHEEGRPVRLYVRFARRVREPVE